MSWLGWLESIFASTKPMTPLDGLTRREIEVLRLLSQGMTTAEIAKHLFIARSTAKVHIRNIFVKLGVRTRLQAALKAHQFLENEVS